MRMHLPEKSFGLNGTSHLKEVHLVSHEMPKFTPMIQKVDWVPTKWLIITVHCK